VATLWWTMMSRWRVVFRLRGNIVMDDDVALARREIETLVGARVRAVGDSEWAAFVRAGWLSPHDVAIGSDTGYCCESPSVDVARLFWRLSFCEWVLVVAPTDSASWMAGVPRRFARVRVVDGRVCALMLPFNTVAEWSGVIVNGSETPDESVARLERVVDAVLSGDDGGDRARAVSRSCRATGHLFHGLHVYKAKFFPRLARACLNECAAESVLDPFVGSGTALVEASVMGVRSLGVDIDPLAVAIARAKLSLLHAGGETAEAIAEVLRRLERDARAPMRCACLPPFLSRRLPDDVVHAVETDVGACLALLSDLPWCSPLHIALSDAIARKFKFRFVGLGHARFSLSVARSSVRVMFLQNLRWLARSCAVWQWLRAQSGVRLAPATVLHGDARELPLDDGTVQAIVTSPPYMPASSGRESYLRSKACSLIALGLMDAETIDATEHAQMGSVVDAGQIDDCPAEARELVAWLETDPSRRVKAQPTARYFADLQRVFAEMARVLQTGGRCAVIVASRHVFYRYRTREIVRAVPNAEIVAQMGVRAGLELTHTVPVELRKRDAVARPRARDSYAETVLEFRKRD